MSGRAGSKRARRRLSPVAIGLVCGAVLATVGCQRQPDVQVQAWVGPRHAKQDPERLATEAAKVSQTVLAELLPSPPTEEETLEAAAARMAAHPPTTTDEMAGLLTALRTGPLSELAGPAHRIAAADIALWPEIKALLLAERKAPKGDYRSLLSAIGGDVPNRYGYFKLAWKKAHGFRVKLSEDWFGDLLALPRSKVSSVLRKVYRDCVLQTALLRAASRIGQDSALTGDVVAVMLDAAYHHQGTFRDEVGRAATAIGDEAIPHLVAASLLPPGRAKDDDPRVLRARYSDVLLDRMDRLHPQRAIDAVRNNPRLLSDTLAAYGTARVGEAAAPLLAYADAADPTVRAAARTAMMAYVEGPPPKARRRTIRLLGGATSNARAYLTYRQRASIAIRERLATQMPELIEPDCGAPDRGEDRRTNAQIEACADQPRRHVTAYFDALDERRALRRTQRIDAALAEPSVSKRVAALDELLAIEPNLPETDVLVTQYRAAAATALDEKDTAKAAQLLRKSAMLTEAAQPEQARHLRVTALLAEAATEGLSSQGRVMLLGTASRLAPEDTTLAQAHAQAATTETVRAGAAVPWASVSIGFAGGLFALGLLGWAFAPIRRRLT